MTRFRTFLVAGAVIATASAAALPDTIAAMRWQRRVLLVAALGPADAQLALQRHVLAEWKGGEARDLSFVQVIGDRVEGSADRAAALRRRFDLPSDRFAALLIGKDGGVKRRWAQSIPAETLQGTIDAMPMRRAGQR